MYFLLYYYHTQEYHPTDNGTITLRGQRLNWAATPDDYKVHIGNSTCQLLFLNSTHLMCCPPEQQPAIAGQNHTYYNNAYLPNVWVSLDIRALQIASN